MRPCILRDLPVAELYESGSNGGLSIARKTGEQKTRLTRRASEPGIDLIENPRATGEIRGSLTYEIFEVRVGLRFSWRRHRFKATSMDEFQNIVEHYVNQALDGFVTVGDEGGLPGASPRIGGKLQDSRPVSASESPLLVRRGARAH